MTKRKECPLRPQYPRHGMKHSPEHRAWWNMVNRCKNPKGKNRHYTGIQVAPELRTFLGFLAILGRKPIGTTLDRIDSKGNYAAGNVRWATPLEQNRNRSNTVLVTYCGETKTAMEWSKHLRINYNCFKMRLHRKLPPDKLFAPYCLK